MNFRVFDLLEISFDFPFIAVRYKSQNTFLNLQPVANYQTSGEGNSPHPLLRPSPRSVIRFLESQ